MTREPVMLYMDSGTSTTRAYLIRDGASVDRETVNTGTKDSAISGSNDVLLSGMLRCCDSLLRRNGLPMEDVDEIWASGMVTNTFGVVEVEHVSTPVDAAKLLSTAWRHREDKYFRRDLMLIRGAKTAQPGQQVTLDNVARMNNVRGEEIEAIGLAAGGVLPVDVDCALISPGSHSHSLLVRNGAITDILSTFTGEVNHAIRKETILGGELADGPVTMEPEHVLRGLQHLESYGFSRALYIIHATKVFGIADDAVRTQMLEGVIAGSTISVLRSKIDQEWKDVQRIVIKGGQPYMEAYRILCSHLMPDRETVMYDTKSQADLALRGFLHIIKLRFDMQ